MNLGKYNSNRKFSLERLVIVIVGSPPTAALIFYHRTNLCRLRPSSCCWLCCCLSETSFVCTSSNVFVFMKVLYCSNSASVKYCSKRLVTTLPLLSILDFKVLASSSCSKSFSLLFLRFSWNKKIIHLMFVEDVNWVQQTVTFLSHLFIFIPIFLEIDQTNFRASQPWWKTQ